MNTDDLEVKELVDKLAKKTPSLFYRYFEAFRAAANSPDNEWYTGEVFGPHPKQSEKIIHFAVHADRVKFRREFLLKNQDLLWKPQDQPQVVPA